MLARLTADFRSRLASRRTVSTLALFALGALGCTQVLAQGKEPWQEYEKYIQSAKTMTALGPDLFGDEVNAYNNTLSFSVTDISIPGNNALPVSLTRTLSISDKTNWPIYDLPMADWDLDLPNITGTFSQQFGWTERCSPRASTGAAPTPPGVTVTGGTSYPSNEFWTGHNASMPNGAGGELLWVTNPNTPKPATGGTYYWMTNTYTYFSCIPSKNESGREGFLAVTADGTKYWFDWAATFRLPPMNSPKTAEPDPFPLYRVRIALYATRVEDRFGNAVVYTYTNSAGSKVKLTKIEGFDRSGASDGRVIQLTLNANGTVATAFTPATTATASVPATPQRKWIYGYPEYGDSLGTVTLPDNTSWTLHFAPLSHATIDWDGDPGAQDCGSNRWWIGGGGTGTVTHPSGAVGTFTVEPKRFGRTNVPMFCVNWEKTGPFNPTNDVAVFPRNYEVLAIRTKSIAGPGLATQTWTYSGSSMGSWIPGQTEPVDCSVNLDCVEPVCMSDDCAGTNKTLVNGPDGWVRYTFGNSYRYNEGKLLSVERGALGSAAIETETITYRLPTAHYPATIAGSLQGYFGGFESETPRPQTGNSILRDGVTFASTVNAFDVFDRETSVTRSSSLGYSKTEVTEFVDVIDEATNTYRLPRDLVARTITNGIEVNNNAYDPVLFTPTTQKAFGAVQHVLAHNADGTLLSVTDGNSKKTDLSSWFRGVPRLVTRPDATVESTVIDNNGWLTQVTNEVGASTKYQYDPMGRLKLVDYVDGDAVNWTSTTRTLALVAATEFSTLVSGHWTETSQTGNGRTTTYYDARWNPVVVQTEDLGSAASKSYVVKRYNVDGQVVFQSYPVASLVSLDPQVQALEGTWTTYDALGRVTLVEQDSELGKLRTITEYLPGFITRVTNPRGFKTTTRYQVFDEPTTDAPVSVISAEGTAEQQRTVIARDMFGMPASVIRSGPNG
jgi:YD repeat-containing protein